MSSILSRLLIPTAVALLCCGCERETAPAGITCDQIRTLRVDMSLQEVRAVVGAPLHDDVVGPQGSRFRGADRQWGWSNKSDGVRLYFGFAEDRLIGGESWISTTLRFFFDNERKPSLFELDENGLQEFPDFERVYCPSR